MLEKNVSIVQMNAKLGDKKSNFNKIEKILERDLTGSPDLIVLPEVFAIGWKPEIFQQNAEKPDGDTCKFLSEIAKKYKTNVIGGSFIELETRDKKLGTSVLDRYYNTCPVFTSDGEMVAAYRKMHLFKVDEEEKYLNEGNEPVIVELAGMKVGLTICYDIRFPELYREYRKAGADLFVNVAAWGLAKPIPWEIMTRSRAVENQTYMAALTQCGHIDGDAWNIGHSRIIDYKGEVLSEIKDQQEGLVCATIDLDEMHHFREKYPVLEDIKDNYEVS